MPAPNEFSAFNENNTKKEKDLNHVLQKAIREGSYKGFLIKLPEFSPNLTFNNGDTLLHIAARHSRADIVKLLLLRGAMYDAKNIHDQTALDLSRSTPVQNMLEGTSELFNDNLTKEECKNSLDKGAVVTAKDTDGNTPLHIALKHKNHLVVPLLLQNGALINEKNNLGETPLNIAKGDSARYLVYIKFKLNYILPIITCLSAITSLVLGVYSINTFKNLQEFLDNYISYLIFSAIGLSMITGFSTYVMKPRIKPNTNKKIGLKINTQPTTPTTPKK